MLNPLANCASESAGIGFSFDYDFYKRTYTVGKVYPSVGKWMMLRSATWSTHGYYRKSLDATSMSSRVSSETAADITVLSRKRLLQGLVKKHHARLIVGFPEGVPVTSQLEADKNVKEDPMATDFGIISLGYVNLDQVMKEAESNINTKDTTTLVSAAPSTEVPSVSDSKPVPHRDVLVVVVVDSLVVVVVDSLVVSNRGVIGSNRWSIIGQIVDFNMVKSLVLTGPKGLGALNWRAKDSIGLGQIVAFLNGQKLLV
ncbi:hypothetical protein Tco_0442597 [Tanacetum coccineum]